MERIAADEATSAAATRAPDPINGASGVPPVDGQEGDAPAADLAPPSLAGIGAGGLGPSEVGEADLAARATAVSALPGGFERADEGVIDPPAPCATVDAPGADVDAPPLDGARGIATGEPGHVEEVRERFGSDLPETSVMPLVGMPGLMAPRAEAPVPALGYWRRSLVLGGAVIVLGALTAWEAANVPDRPARPVVSVATVAPGAAPLDPGIADAIRRVLAGLRARDVAALVGAVDPDGLVVAPFSGGIPESGYATPDTRTFLADAMTDARLVALGWRSDPRGRIFLLVDGWRPRALRLSPNSTLELSPLVALVLQNRAGAWHLRWFLIDASGALTQQARTLTWQPIP